MLHMMSWNVNGIRSALNKGLSDIITKNEYDAILLQEVKIDAPPTLLGSKYYSYIFPAEKKGYSGVLSMVKRKPLKVTKGIGNEEFDKEGRVLTLEYDDYFLINTYFPNSRRDLSRLDFKLRFDQAILKYFKKLNTSKPLVITGDFNVAHTELDIARAKENDGNAGFTKEERGWFSKLLEDGYVDTFRIFKKESGHYSWWLFAFNAREHNIGWRIDYFIVSKALEDKVKNACILSDVHGSDHAPVELDLDL
ncbi:MAG: exodeoxyribonuclease III [Candidatus Marsarchaeota archaeon]|nr:exodeoxyribonuclease III [Candidatus Marsarchaeota archaeon]